MTIDKDFKKIVRARMEKTGESYTSARAALLKETTETGTRSEYVDRTVFGHAVDGRITAEDPDVPGVVGYGPSKRYALMDQSRRESAKRYAGTPFASQLPVVVTKVRDRGGRWTAYMIDNPPFVGEGANRWSALDALEQKLSPKERDRYTRTVVLEEHDDGRWSAKAEGEDSCGAIGWGATRNEAEEKLMNAEETNSFMNQSIEDYGADRDHDF
jgi:hypothetical protein